jgi:predicted negative regulator of RcsB-dependent stress response
VNRFLFLSVFHSSSRLLLVFAFLVSFLVAAHAQVPAEPTKSPTTAESSADTTKPADPNTAAATGQAAPQSTSPEALQTRIERARALIAAHRLDTAASELESVRATAQDNTLRNIASIMLMNVYLEAGNYGRAEALLEETFKARVAQKDESLGTYFALSGQAVIGARTHLARYRSFGVSTTDGNLPAEAASDLNRLRSLLERMIVQAKEISNGRRAYDSLSLLEDVLGLRLSLAKDSEDQSKWASEYASAREALASSQTQIASLGGVPPLRPGKTPVSNASGPSPYSTKRAADTSLEANNHAEQPRAGESADAAQFPAKQVPGADNKVTQSSTAKPGEPDVDEAGSLTPFAIKKVVPRYPTMAKQSGTTGLVRVHVIVEGGKVIAVSRSEGPILLRSAAEDAVRQWSFQVVSIEGRPTRLSGYIDFNFSL